MKISLKKKTYLFLVLILCVSLTYGTVFAEELIVEETLVDLIDAEEEIQESYETEQEIFDLGESEIQSDEDLEPTVLLTEDLEPMDPVTEEVPAGEDASEAEQTKQGEETCAKSVIIIEEISAVENPDTLNTDFYEALAPLSVTYINPLYRGVITEEDLVEPDPYGISLLGDIEYLSKEEGGELLRAQMKERVESIPVSVTVTAEEFGEALLYDIFNKACVHTGEPDEGDYLQWHYAGWSASVTGHVDSETSAYCVTITYTITYYTTAEQEAAVDAAVAALKSSLGLQDETVSDFRKVKNIYDYICDHVTYDHENLKNDEYKLKFTAYAALINETAVCQGYASLFYRLALEAGIDARLIGGDGGGAHGWNIVKLGNYYYNLDTTWDAGKYIYDYFLKCPSGFSGHTRYEEYDTEAFHAAYPMGSENFSSSEHAEYDGWSISGGTLIVRKNVDDLESAAKQPWASFASGIQEIVIANGVTSIGDYAFADCTALTEMVLPTGVTSIGTSAFSGCTNLAIVRKQNGTAYTLAEITEKGLGEAFADTKWYMHEHTAGMAVVENRIEPACEETGSYDLVTYCTECYVEMNRKEEVIPKTGHTEGTAVREKEVAATCEEDGSYDSVVYCTVESCKKEVSRITETIPKTGHTEGTAVREKEVAATCEEDGSYDSVVYCTVEGCKKELSRITETIPKTGHIEGTAVREKEVAATCEEDGSYDSVVYCMVENCKKELSRITETIPKTGHTEVKDRAVARTCTETGLTEGSHCSVCSKVIKAQEVTAAAGHTKVTDQAVAKTCMKPGLTEGSHCSVCGTVIKAQEPIPASHNPAAPVKEKILTVTCERNGTYDSVVYCSDCKKEISRKTVTTEKAPGHTKVTDPAVEPTCLEAGLTEGSHCSVCKKVLVKQVVIDAVGEHSPSASVMENRVEPTCVMDGSYEAVVYCMECDAEISRDVETIPASGHTAVADGAMAPSCTSEGKTAGSHCLICGEILTAQKAVPAIGHSGEWVTVSEATIKAQELQERICKVCGEKETRSVGALLDPFISFNAKSLRMKKGQTAKTFQVSFAAEDSIEKLKTNKKKMVSVSVLDDGFLKIKALKKTGTVKLTVTLESGLKKTVSIRIVSGKITTSSLKLSPKKKTMAVGDTYELLPVVKPITSQDKLKFSSSNKRVATVSSKGLVKAKKRGKAKITVRSGKKTVTCSITVK